MLYKYILAIKDIYILLIMLLVYGCSSSGQSAVDWDSINYSKILCSDDGGCNSDDDIVSAIGRGKR